jgi:hypothetical protein
MRAEIKAGKLLAEIEKNKGTRGQTRRGRKVLPPQDATPKLADLGVSKTQSSRWQALAELRSGGFNYWLGRHTYAASSAASPCSRRV